MLKSIKHNWIGSGILSDFPSLKHGFSTRPLGDARTEGSRTAMLTDLGIDPASLRRGDQVHGVNVEMPGTDAPVLYERTDALVTNTQGVAIGVITADCVPVIIADPAKRVVGIAHGGWKGLTAGIIAETVSAMKRAGSATDTLYAAIGPRIGACCYSVSAERAEIFRTVFPEGPVVIRDERGMFIDLGKAAFLALRAAGIPAERIDYGISCTSCQNDTFYSYRKDTAETFGEMLSVVTLV